MTRLRLRLYGTNSLGILDTLLIGTLVDSTVSLFVRSLANEMTTV